MLPFFSKMIQIPRVDLLILISFYHLSILANIPPPKKINKNKNHNYLKPKENIKKISRTGKNKKSALFCKIDALQ